MAFTVDDSVIDWLLAGDPAIRWQVYRDLLDADANKVQVERERIAYHGWGQRLLAEQSADWRWGGGFYSPKWTSTTYTLLLLRRLGLEPSHEGAREACHVLLNRGFYSDGGINLFVTWERSETCVTGMVLSLLGYFRIEDPRREQIVDFLLGEQMGDGGWNCEQYLGAVHSSFHTTISVLEGLREFEQAASYRAAEVARACRRAVTFLLQHRLFRSDHTGEVVDARMTRFSFPPRWRYDVLRVLDYLQAVAWPPDPRLEDALELLHKKRRVDGRWVLQNRHPGRTFFELEEVGQPSRWNTLRALRVLRRYGRHVSLSGEETA